MKSNVSHLSYQSKLKYLDLLKERLRRDKYNKFAGMFPDTGELKRDLYVRHLEFFEAGLYHPERLFMAGNRVGKTEAGGYEITCHLTGNYPSWWKGKTFDRRINAMAAGDTSATTKDIIQKKLLGGEYGTESWGTGIIPKECLGKPTIKPGITGAYSEVPIKHKSGGWSTLKLRSYEQGRKIFQGTEEDVVWMDEECPYDVYEEALVRTMTTNGIFILTFTPLTGLTELVKAFLEARKEQTLKGDSTKYTVQAGWDHAPHLTEPMKKKLGESLKLKPHQLKARRDGTPSLGSGAIYPIPKEDIEVKPFLIPKHWPKAYGMDVGWNRTAVAWGAWDRDEDVVYLYSEHYMGDAKPAQHTAAIKGRGTWICGTIDPASRGRSQKDGERLIEAYLEGGLNVIPANNAVEAGIYEVLSRLSTGRLKVFSNCSNWFEEIALYRRDEKGKIVKENDHIMDATRYLIMMLIEIMTTPPVQSSGRNRSKGDWRA